ncbi:porin [Hahella sp. CCB-MM4]|uniref:porin n=1 Tax=Hahella sp. (strain CCB-MM4) TaxID=1926491 RepID=UPI000B9A85FE|nr:hypothetical protein [Hahella sp. CCB-MM4]
MSKDIIKTILLPTSLATAIAMPITSFSAEPLKSGNDKVNVTFSGHVNRGVLMTDDGKEQEVYQVDNDASSTRFRIIGEAKPDDQMTVGAAIEVQFESNSTADVNQNTADSDTGTDSFTQRRLEVYFDHKEMGRLWVGQGWTATETTSESDLSGTNLAGYSDVDIQAGGTLFRDADGALTTTNVKSVLSNFDGQGRKDRLRYDTPKFGGLTYSIGAFNGGWDTALRYAGKLGSNKIAAALGYSKPNGSKVESQINGSASLLLENGLNFTIAAGQQSLYSDAEDPSSYYGKIGYQASLIDAGKSLFSLDYGVTKDLAAVDDEATATGVQYVQKIDDWATEAYISYHLYSLDRTGSDLEDVNALLVGARVKF